MNKYLEKIAESSEDGSTRKKGAMHYARDYLLGGFAGAAGGASAVPIAHHLISMAIKAPNSMSEADGRVALDEMPRKYNATTNINKIGNHSARELLGSFAGRAGPAFFPRKSVQGGISLLHMTQPGKRAKPVMTKSYLQVPWYYRDNSNVVAHEIGHMVDFGDSKSIMHKVKALSGAPRLATRVTSAGMFANDKTRDYAWAVPIVTNLPTWRSEAAANYHAAKLIASKGGTVKNFVGKFAVPQMGHYVSVPVMEAAALALAAKAYKHFSPKKDE